MSKTSPPPVSVPGINAAASRAASGVNTAAGGGGAFLLVVSVLFTGYLYLTGRLDNVIQAIQMPGGSLLKPAPIAGTGGLSVQPTPGTSPMPSTPAPNNNAFEIDLMATNGNTTRFYTTPQTCFADVVSQGTAIGMSQAEAYQRASQLCGKFLVIPPRFM